MSVLYKNQKDIIYEADIIQVGGLINLMFSCDGGKFGTDEILDEFNYTPLELLEILQEHESKIEEE